MEIQEFLTYFINTLVLSSILFFLLDFCFVLLNSWQQLNPSAQPDGAYKHRGMRSGLRPGIRFQVVPDPNSIRVTAPHFYQQVKDLLWENDPQLAL